MRKCYITCAIPFISLLSLFSIHESALANQFSQVRDNHIDSLDPKNRQYLENFCRFHPTSSLCYFTPNPLPPKPPSPKPVDPSLPPIIGTPGNPPPPPAECASAGAVSPTTMPSTFKSAFASLSGGRTLILAPGQYPVLTASGRSFGGATIRCAKAGACQFGTGSRLDRSSGLTIDGITIKGGGAALFLADSTNITVRCSTFSSQTNSGVTVYGGGQVQIDKNVFHNTIVPRYLPDGSPEGGMDYGIRLYEASSVYIRSNYFTSMFNHALSFKHTVKYGLVEGNTFDGCGRTCINLGQEPNDIKYSSRPVGQVVLNRNIFKGKAGLGVAVRNIMKATITNNDFSKFICSRKLSIGGYTRPVKGGRPLLGDGTPAGRQVVQSGNIGL